MKKLAVILGILVGMNCFAAYANCDTDVAAMRAEVAKWGSITTPDNTHRFTAVANQQRKRALCTADGYYGTAKICVIEWTMDDWGPTFHCATA